MTNQKEKLLQYIIGFLITSIVLPAVVWAFSIIMQTRDDVQQLKADISWIRWSIQQKETGVVGPPPPYE